jgi:hypothetical protein
MIDAGWDREEVRKLLFENPVEFFSQSPHFDYADAVAAESTDERLTQGAEAE